MTINQITAQFTDKLQKNKIKNPHLEAEILLSHILKKPREFLFTYPKKILTKLQITNYKLQISQRIKGMPLAYITGHKEFYEFDFIVNKHVLIPRPETELMVDEALSLLRSLLRSKQKITVIDVGTGSGCILISLIKSLQKPKAQNPNCKFLATDISKPALAVARKNAKLHKVDKKIKFLHGNLLETLIKNNKIPATSSSIYPGETGVVILANLPYLAPDQIKNSPTIQREPKSALEAGPDGLRYYKKLFAQINQIANHTPAPAAKLQITVFCEIDPSQILKIKKLIKSILPNSKLQIKKDLRGLNRLIIANIKT